MSLKLLVELLDQEPGCGTMPPRKPPRPHPHPDGDPASYTTRLVITAAHDAATLHKLSTIGGALQEVLHKAANTLFDNTCGSIPLPELLQLLHQHWPPPPPSPGVRFVEQLVALHAVSIANANWHKIEPPLEYSKTLAQLIQEALGHGIDSSGPGNPHTNVSIHLPIPVPPRPIGGIVMSAAAER